MQTKQNDLSRRVFVKATKIGDHKPAPDTYVEPASLREPAKRTDDEIRASIERLGKIKAFQSAMRMAESSSSMVIIALARRLEGEQIRAYFRGLANEHACKVVRNQRDNEMSLLAIDQLHRDAHLPARVAVSMVVHDTLLPRLACARRAAFMACEALETADADNIIDLMKRVAGLELCRLEFRRTVRAINQFLRGMDRSWIVVDGAVQVNDQDIVGITVDDHEYPFIHFSPEEVGAYEAAMSRDTVRMKKRKRVAWEKDEVAKMSDMGHEQNGMALLNKNETTKGGKKPAQRKKKGKSAKK